MCYSETIISEFLNSWSKKNIVVFHMSHSAVQKYRYNRCFVFIQRRYVGITSYSYKDKIYIL